MARGVRKSGAAALFFAAATVVMTWPVVADLRHFISDPGDPLFSAWVLHWDWKQTFHDPIHLFDANIFFPARWALAFSEHMWGVAVVGFPLFFAGVEPIAVYNILFLIGVAFSGFAAWLLVTDITGDALASIFAGVLYAFVPFRLEHFAHIHMQWGGFLPLFLLFLRRYFASRRAPDLAAFTFFFVWNALAGIQYAVIGSVALAALLVIKTTRYRLWRSLNLAKELSLSFACALVAILPFTIPYFRASRRYHLIRRLGDVEFYSAWWTSFLASGGRNKLYGALTARFDKPECELFFGVTATILAVMGAVRLWRPSPSAIAESGRRRTRRWILAWDAAIIAVAGLRLLYAAHGGWKLGPFRVHEPFRLSALLALLVFLRLAVAFPNRSRYQNLGDFVRRGPWSDDALWALTLVVLGLILPLGAHAFPYRTLFEVFPFVFRSIRVPARQVILAHIGLGVLSAYAVHFLRVRSPRARILVPALCCGLALFEDRAAPLSVVRADIAPKPFSAWLASAAFSGGVVELPMKTFDNIDYVFRAIEHGRPIANGYSSFSPPEFLQLQDAFAGERVADSAFDDLRARRLRVLIFHPGVADRRERISIPAWLMRRIARAELNPVGVFRDARGTDLAFEIRPARGSFSIPPLPASRAEVAGILASPLPSRLPPEGWYFGPQNGAVFSGSAIAGAGWAAADDGIARVAILLDGRDVGSATYGKYRPDVPYVKPYVSCKEFCGYSYRIDGVPPGRHALGVRYFGKNGVTSSPPAVEVRVVP